MTATKHKTGSANPKVYIALLTQSVSDTISTGLLTIGRQYLIISNTTGDFTNVGAANNNAGTMWTATGTTPTSWGDAVVAQNIEPIATVLENTLGNITWIRTGVGEYESSVINGLLDDGYIVTNGTCNKLGHNIGTSFFSGSPGNVTQYYSELWFESGKMKISTFSMYNFDLPITPVDDNLYGFQLELYVYI